MIDMEMVTKDEAALVQRIIMLEFAVKTLEYDLKVIRSSNAKAADLYATHMIDAALQIAYQHMAEARLKLRKAGITIKELTPRDRKHGRWHYRLRGYLHVFIWEWGLLKAEVEEYINSLINTKSPST